MTLKIGWILVVSLFSLSVYAESKKPDLNSIKIEVKGVGTVTFKHDVPGEPVAMPERVDVLMTCLKEKRPKRVRLFRMCSVEEYTYEAGVKTLYLKLALGRVDGPTGRVTCDRFEHYTMDLTSVCVPGKK